jgi:hypothetical protein
MQKFLKILAALGIISVGTGAGAGMNESGVDYWTIAIVVVGWFMSWLVASKYGTLYQKAKNVIDAIDDALEDDSISLDEIQAIIKAFKGK